LDASEIKIINQKVIRLVADQTSNTRISLKKVAFFSCVKTAVYVLIYSGLLGT